MDKARYLLLENGTVFEGKAFGAEGDVTGEVVFTTAMTGYLETLTDPSHYGQIVVQTFPLIGNYGVIPEDFESRNSFVKGYIVRDWCQEPSNFRNQGDLDTFLREQNVPGIYGIDTRALTKIVRESGVMNGIILSELPEDKSKVLWDIKQYRITEAVANTSRSEREVHLHTNETEHPKKIALKEKISYKDVWFKYQEAWVLKGINLDIRKGTTVALVGQSGSGKSTLVDLLPRFYDVNKGNIRIDDTDIREATLFDLRGLMGNVNQEAILFNDTFFNNIAFGVEGATMEQVEEAARIANAHDFIIASEKGYDTNIGDRGGKLSGGQRQRISIARAILKNPPILILDEATSALDTESERLVQEALENLMKNRTTVVIAHRLSTIRNADEICVMHEGEIVERGKHEELLALDGYYKRLCDMQSF